ncbi:MAG: GatB/YqeY domain-containing protein [Acidimicrobiales bacterium]|nr:GatB/YqeY domain-containing protein [Hyphomonadaceae bacterium]RZV43211.1 MAG: GatB/YqeY domain-containing protein [Acidimicrobiales bacterium]
MTLRSDIMDGMKTAMKEKETLALSTLRLVNAAIKDRDIAARAEDRPNGIDEVEILSLLAKMVKQRDESARIYDENGRPELAERERSEMDVIKRYMPQPLSADELNSAVQSAVEELDATCLKDMGRVMGVLKGKYAGRMDMGKASAAVKNLLAS